MVEDSGFEPLTLLIFKLMSYNNRSKRERRVKNLLRLWLPGKIISFPASLERR